MILLEIVHRKKSEKKRRTFDIGNPFRVLESRGISWLRRPLHNQRRRPRCPEWNDPTHLTKCGGSVAIVTRYLQLGAINWIGKRILTDRRWDRAHYDSEQPDAGTSNQSFGVSERVSERMSAVEAACEASSADEWVAQFLRPNSWLFWAIKQRSESDERSYGWSYIS